MCVACPGLLWLTLTLTLLGLLWWLAQDGDVLFDRIQDLERGSKEDMAMERDHPNYICIVMIIIVMVMYVR